MAFCFSPPDDHFTVIFFSPSSVPVVERQKGLAEAERAAALFTAPDTPFSVRGSFHTTQSGSIDIHQRRL